MVDRNFSLTNANAHRERHTHTHAHILREINIDGNKYFFHNSEDMLTFLKRLTCSRLSKKSIFVIVRKGMLYSFRFSRLLPRIIEVNIGTQRCTHTHVHVLYNIYRHSVTLHSQRDTLFWKFREYYQSEYRNNARIIANGVRAYAGEMIHAEHIAAFPHYRIPQTRFYIRANTRITRNEKVTNGI